MAMKVTTEFDPETEKFEITVEGIKSEYCEEVVNSKAVKSLLELLSSLSSVSEA